MALLKVICWVIIFIARIRFPPGKSLATILNIVFANITSKRDLKFENEDQSFRNALHNIDFGTQPRSDQTE